MANGEKQVTVWRDSKGHTGRTSFYVTSATVAGANTAAAAVETAMLPLSNCARQAGRGPNTSVAGPVVYGTTAQFAGVEDKVVMTFSGADGQLHRYQVPAPKIDIFEVDQLTVDPSQTDVAAFVTAALANIQTASGQSLSSFVGGLRVRRKTQRKLNIFIRVPELDEPAE